MYNRRNFVVVRLTPAETRERREDVIKHQDQVLKAYREGRPMGRLADDWEVGTKWLIAQFTEWGEPLRPSRKVPAGPRLGTRVLLQVDGKVLLVPSEEANPGGERTWRLPGGWVPPGSRIAETATRELLAATGLAREVTHLVALAELPDTDPSGACHAICTSTTPLTHQEVHLLSAGPDPRTALVPLDALPHYAPPPGAHLIHTYAHTDHHGTPLPLQHSPTGDGKPLTLLGAL
jgi:ADP-ribose pyrophosphatase YjhB (NUDIX family)